MAIRWWVVGAAASALAGCGDAEGKFVAEYTTAYCDFYLQCADPAELVFDGMDTQDECEGTYGPEFLAEGEGCKLDHPAAKACLDQLGALQCPPENAVLDSAIPPACDAVWKKCEGGT